MLQLCRSHHRLIHEGGWRVQANPDGHFAFYRPDGTPLDNPTIAVTAGDDHIRHANTARGIHPTPDTPVCDWDGERPDYGYIIQGLLYTRHTPPMPPTTEPTFPRERPPDEPTP